jgi:hypothetical protein
MLVFYSPDSLGRLANAQTFFIFMDGTFSIIPHPFRQLYIIRVPFKDVAGTAVYASCQINVKKLTGNSSSLLLTTVMPATYNSMSRL